MTITQSTPPIEKSVWTKRRRSPQHRPARHPVPWVGDVFAVVIGLGLGATVGLFLTGESIGSLDAPGGWFVAAGRLAALTGAYLMLVMVVLVARLSGLERSIGQDRLVRWHRRIAPWALGLIGAHIVLITLGYAKLSKVGALHQLWVFVTTYPDLLAAFVAFGLLIVAGITSIKYARRRMKHETWWVIHLYLYLALALAFAHQIATGASFVGHPLTRAIWISVWAATAGTVIVFRILLPFYRSLRHQLRVVAVHEEAPGVYSVICKGRHIDGLAVSGGQFFQWRFMTRGLWWHSHPYSLSALPRPPYVRVTVKGLGDQSRAVAHLTPGTRVFIEGPYGSFTHHVRSTDKVVLIGAGVGITPLRALLEDLPRSVQVTVITRASTAEDLVHRDEVASLVKERRGDLHELVGSRRQTRLDARTLKRLVPDIAESDLYVCGPKGFNDSLIGSAIRLAVRRDQIHQEVFSF